MCTLVNKMPEKKKRKGGKRERDILNLIKLEPTLNEKKPYRFRMLWFKNEELNKRNSADVVKMVHEYSWKDDEGNNRYEYVTCPTTKYVNWDSNPYETCPMCKTAGKYFDSFKESGYKDRDIRRELNKHKAKRIALIPVYIVQDPNNPANNGKYGVFKIREADMEYVKNEETGKWITIDPYETLQKEIDVCATKGGFPYNTNAVDLAVWVKSHEGGSGDNTYSYNKIKKLKLTNKPYEIADITGENIKEPFGLTFDNECFTTVTKEELAKFYEKHIGATVDIPDDDLDFDDDETVEEPKSTAKKETKKATPEPVDDDLDELDDDISMDMDEDKLDELSDEIDEMDDIDVDDLIDSVVDDKPTDKSPDKDNDEVDDDLSDLDDLDDFIDDLEI